MTLIASDFSKIEMSCLRTMMGKPLTEEAQARLLACLENPTQATWDDAHTLMIQGMLTLWQAVLHVQPSFPRSARLADDLTTVWDEIPTTDTLVRALRYAAFEHGVQK